MNIKTVNYKHGISTKTKKVGIVIHGTGGGTVDGAIASFSPTGVSVPYIIDRTGNVYKLYDEALDHWHAGANFRDISRKTIGIELVNWNHLTELNGLYYTWTKKLVKKDEIVLSPKVWRGYQAFHNIPKAQHNALCELLALLCSKYSITKALTRDFNPDKIKDTKWSGICFHSSFHPEKTDFYPMAIDKIQI